ncbi:MAG: CRTAC1 family protein [Acidobacteriota bacterium]|nr:CRTAC1 family protein [Acidobacteriota bacterium]
MAAFSWVPIFLLLTFSPAFGEDSKEDQQSPEICVDTIVGEIGRLESDRDPKCYATATRLENFMYGTPLTSEARLEKTELQKALITHIWAKASTKTRAESRSLVTPEDLKTPLADSLAWSKKENGDIHIPHPDGEIVLAHTDIRQYASVAYAFRAVLAVQQDAMLDPSFDLAPLDQDAVKNMRTLIDIYTLASLNLADKAARLADESTMSAQRLKDAWQKLARAGKNAAPTKAPNPVAASAPQSGFPILTRIIDQKLASYRNYNQKAIHLFMSNIKSFFARHDWPDDSAEIERIQNQFSNAMVYFTGYVLFGAQEKAKAAGSALIRADHVETVLQEIVPYSINEFEDIIFFPNLDRDSRLIIEAYDADAFRDSGIHWQFLRSTIRNPSLGVTIEPDPFAAELIVEGVAQYGVLLFRLMGDTARAENAPAITAGHIQKALQAVQGLAKRHASAPPLAEGPDKLVSSAGKTSKTEGAWFSDVTDEAGLDFVHKTSDWLSRFQRSFLYQKPGENEDKDEARLTSPPSFSGAGVAAEDIDGDGFEDILLLGGAGNKLFRNNGKGGFVDITARAGLVYTGADGFPGETRQPLIADLDNDGRQDIVITYVNDVHRVYRNKGDATFEDVSDKAGLGGKGLVGGAATVFDYDNDGLLDLYICYYGDYLNGARPSLVRNNVNGQTNKLFRNKGNFVFEDVTEKAGAGNSGWSQAVSHTDIDGDGLQDLIVGNDFGSNAYLRNKGDGTFEDLARQWGTDVPSNSMNVGLTDLNGDTHPDVYISNIFIMVKDEKYVLPNAETPMKFNPEKLATMRVVEANHLFTSKREGDRFTGYRLSDAVGRGYSSTGWAWDADFFDFDNDGDDDLYCTNGLNEYNLYAKTSTMKDAEGEEYVIQNSARDRDTNVFFVNENGKLNNRGQESGADLLGNSRSAAYLDMDNDGDLDMVVTNFHLPAVLYRNNTQSLGNQWLKIKLVGNPAKATNRDAIGSRLLIKPEGGKTIWREVTGGVGYQSLHPKVQHAGLGKATRADVEIRWPNGDKQVVRNLDAGRIHTITQP